jgi:hypothetical protein
MEIDEYIQHTNKILKGLESLDTINEENIPQLKFHGILIYDDTRECFNIVGIRELQHTFKSEFKNSMLARDNGVKYLERD